jgi:hypothetical protein
MKVFWFNRLFLFEVFWNVFGDSTYGDTGLETNAPHSRNPAIRLVYAANKLVPPFP